MISAISLGNYSIKPPATCNKILSEKAWELARKAARLLKSEFSAERVVVFGSLAREDWFTPWSDNDLAAWGIPTSRFFSAAAALKDLSTDIGIDLVDPESCRPGLRATIERDW